MGIVVPLVMRLGVAGEPALRTCGDVETGILAQHRVLARPVDSVAIGDTIVVGSENEADLPGCFVGEVQDELVRSVEAFAFLSDRHCVPLVDGNRGLVDDAQVPRNCPVRLSVMPNGALGNTSELPPPRKHSDTHIFSFFTKPGL